MIEMSEAYAELYFILDQVPNSYIELLPENFMSKLKSQMSLNHYAAFDASKIFYKQKFDDTSINLLKEIYQKYWNNKTYNSDNLFKNNNKIENTVRIEVQNTDLAKYNNNFFAKFKKTILKLLHIN